jgi:hypothetical protein
MSEKVIITIQMDAQEVWSNVLGSAWEDWDWWEKIKYSEGSDWDKVGEITLSITDPNDEENVITKTLGVQDLAKAYAELASKNYGGTNLDIHDLDAVYGDCVLQQAVLGDVVYG